MRKPIKWDRLVPRLLIAVLLISLVSVGATYAKYVAEEQHNNSVNITASLGTISVIGTESYQFLPGVDIDCDTAVKVQKPNNIPVFVYLELESFISNNPQGVQYALSDCWKPVTGQTDVYVYWDTENNKPAVVENSMDSIPVIQDNKIIVSQYAAQTVSGILKMNITAKMAQIPVGETDPAVVYGQLTNP